MSKCSVFLFLGVYLRCKAWGSIGSAPASAQWIAQHSATDSGSCQGHRGQSGGAQGRTVEGAKLPPLTPAPPLPLMLLQAERVLIRSTAASSCPARVALLAVVGTMGKAVRAAGSAAYAPLHKPPADARGS
jgi:hypothetical protein